MPQPQAPSAGVPLPASPPGLHRQSRQEASRTETPPPKVAEGHPSVGLPARSTIMRSRSKALSSEQGEEAPRGDAPTGRRCADADRR